MYDVGMIGKLTGRFDGQTAEGFVLIDVGGVGYIVRTPLLALETVRNSAGGDISLFIHTAVRDDAIDLYGFPTETELSFFKQLMSVSGIGPKTAIGILNVADVTSLRKHIAAGDAPTLIKVFGIGKKSAERIVVELRDKVGAEMELSGTPISEHEDNADVIEALIALGYRTDEARRAVKDIKPSVQGTRDRVSAALQYLGRAR